MDFLACFGHVDGATLVSDTSDGGLVDLTAGFGAGASTGTINPGQPRIADEVVGCPEVWLTESEMSGEDSGENTTR